MRENEYPGSGHEALIPKHGGYRNLITFKLSRLIYDVTLRFCNRYIDKKSRTHDQLVQAARSGVQNIAEGSQVSGTSKKLEIKLTSVARASLEELRLDYEDFLRQRGLEVWAKDDPRRKELVAQCCTTADEVASWVRKMCRRKNGRDGLNGQNGHKPGKIKSMQSINSEMAANSALVLIEVTVSLLDRQLSSLADSFESEGGFTERLYRSRRSKRNTSQ